MNFEMLKRELLESIDDVIGSVTDNKYIRSAMFILGGAIFCLCIYGAYWKFQKRKTVRAYESLVECLTKYKETVADNSNDWKKIVTLCAEKKSQHSGSKLAPYFDLVYSDALYKSGDFQAAVNAMKEASRYYSAHDISYLIRLKCALMQLDSDTVEWQNEGKDLLIKLSEEKQHALVDLALYQLGRYYYAHDDVQQAKNVWNNLAEQYASGNREASEWAVRAQQKLNQLI